MPTYEYKGHQFSSEKELSADEWKQTLAYFDSQSTHAPVPQPPKAEYTPSETYEKNLLSPLLGLSRMMGGASPEAHAEAVKQAEASAEQNPLSAMGGKLTAALGPAVPLMAAAPVLAPAAGLGSLGTGVAIGAATAPVVGGETGMERYQSLINKGVSDEEATRAALIEGIVSGGSNIIPVKGAGILGRALQGAGINVGAGVLSRTAQNIATDDKRVEQTVFDPKQMAIEAILGGVTEGVAGTRPGETFFAKDVPTTPPKIETPPSKSLAEHLQTQRNDAAAARAGQPIEVGEGKVLLDESGKPLTYPEPTATKVEEPQATAETSTVKTETGEAIPQIEIIGEPAPVKMQVDPDVEQKAVQLQEIFDEVKPQNVREFTEAVQKAGVNPEDLNVTEAYKFMNDQYQENIRQARMIALENVNPKLAKQLAAYDAPTLDEALKAIAGSQDEKSVGGAGKWIWSRGRIGIERIKNQGVRSGLSYMIGLRDDAKIAANAVLNGEDSVLRNLTKLEKLRNVDEAAEVFRQRQEAQFDPEYKYNLNPEQTKILNQMDDIFKNIRAEMERITGKKVNEIPNYFPSMFYGPFAVELRDDTGRLIAFVTEKNAKRAKNAAQWVMNDINTTRLKSGKEAITFEASTPKYRKEIESASFRNKGGLAPYFESMLDLLGSEDEVVKQAQESVQNLVAKRAMDTRKFSERFKQKRGVVGAQGDQGWKSARENYYDAKEVFENYVKAFYDWKATQQSADFLNDVKNNAPDQKNIYNTLATYFDDSRGYDRGALEQMGDDAASWMAKSGYDIAGGITKFNRGLASGLTKSWLGFWNPVAMAQNVMQPVNALPKLVELATSGGGSKDVVSPMFQGMANSLRDLWDIAASKTTGKELSETARYLIENEVIKPGLVEAGEGSVSRILGKGAAAVDKYIVSGGLLTTEAYARATTYNIFLEYMKNSGYKIEEARTLAKNLTHEYMVNYESYAKPGVFARTGAAGEIAGRLQSYKMNQLTQLRNYVDIALKEKNPLPLLTALGISAAMAGVTGMVGMDIAEGVHGLLVKAGVMDAKSKSPRQWAMDKGGAVAVGIPSEVSGKWLAGSLSSQIVGDMSWRSVAPVFVGIADLATEKVPTAIQGAFRRATGKQPLPASEEAGALMGIAPAVARGYIEQKMLTDPTGKMVSPYTGKVTYQERPQDEGIFKFTNVRSRERGEASLRKTLFEGQEERIQTKRTSVTDELKKTLDEAVRMGKPVQGEYVAEQLNKIIDLEGDPKNTIKTIESFIKDNQLGGYFEQQALKGNTTISNFRRKLRALEQRQKIGK